MSEDTQNIIYYIIGCLLVKFQNIVLVAFIRSYNLSQTSIEHNYPVLQFYTKFSSLKILVVYYHLLLFSEFE